MSSRHRKLFVLILLVLLVGCHATTKTVDSQPDDDRFTFVDGGEQSEEESESFRPYEYSEPPNLKELVFAEGFKAYTTEQPYLLGYSYDGDYVATIIYDQSQEGYIIDITDTLVNQTVYEAFVPEAERILNGDQVSIDLLSTAQESLDMGYHIKVAPIIHEQSDNTFEQRGNGEQAYRFQMSVDEEQFFRITVHDHHDHTWFVVNDRFPIDSEQDFIHKYTWAIHPQVSDRVNVMVYTAKKGQPVTPYVYTVNTSGLSQHMSEQSLKKTLSEWLDQPKIVYRYPSTANPRAVLAIEEKGEKMTDSASLYAATVGKFVLLDHEGEVIAHANDTGVFNVNGKPLSHSDASLKYEITLVSGAMNHAELFVVDVYDENDVLVQTLQWHWSEKNGTFQLIKPEEEQQ